MNPHERVIALLDNYAALMDALEMGVEMAEDQAETVDETARLDAVLAEFQVAEKDLAAAMEQFVLIDRMIEADIVRVKVLLDGLREKHGQAVNRKGALRRYLLMLLQRADTQRIQTAVGTVHLIHPRHVVITDMAQLPEAYTRVEISPMTREIAAALKDGRDVPGAALEETIGVGIR